jgi:hypothetical protein
MATYLVDHDGGRKRAGRSEPLSLGTIEADDQATAEKLRSEYEHLQRDPKDANLEYVRPSGRPSVG